MAFQLFTAYFTERFFLPIQFIEGVWFKHNAFIVVAVVKAKQVADFVRTFFYYPVNKVVIVPASPVIFILDLAVETTAAPTDSRASPNTKLLPFLKRSW